MSTRIALEPQYLHVDLVGTLLGETRMARAEAEISRREGLTEPIKREYVLANHLADNLGRLGVQELQSLVVDGAVAAGQLIGVQHRFFFKRERELDSPGNRSARFHSPLDVDDSITVHGRFNLERCATASGGANLSGHAPVYLVGTVMDASEEEVTIRPAFIGTRTFLDGDTADDDMFAVLDGREVFPSQVDQFSKVDFRVAASKSDLDLVAKMPEVEVKHALAEIIGEPFVQKDWGGETSDLYTSSLFIDGRQTTSSWLLKGPGARGDMTVKSMGKNGDQIVRLSTEPSELLVLQYWGRITTNAVALIAAFARDNRNPRRYLILDGNRTAQILSAYGKLPTRSTRRITGAK
jgi:hypothetical protein